MTSGTAASSTEVEWADGPRGRTQRQRFWIVWCGSLVGLLILSVVWILAQPPFAGADEPEHFAESQALFSGQFFPPLVPSLAQFESGLARIDLPNVGIGCYDTNPVASAKCDQTSFRGPPKETEVPIYISREPILMPLLTGWPAFLDPHRTGLYLSRFLNALIGSVLLATALAMALSRRRPLMLLGILVATTPSVVAGFGVMGTSTLEIEAALLVWISVVLLLDGEPARRRLIWLATISSLLLLYSRPISFVYLGIAVLVLVIAGKRRALLPFLGRREIQLSVGLIALGTLGAVAWYLFVSAPDNPVYMAANHFPVYHGWSKRVSVPLGTTQDDWVQAIGAVGFNEYVGPWWMTLLWTLLIGGVVGAGLLLGAARRTIAVVFTFVVMLLLPVVTQAVTLPKLWLYWQGRYDLPLLTGAVVVAASVLDAQRARFPEIRRLVVWAVVLMALLQVVELASVLRRYAVGVRGNLSPFDWTSGWRPPLPILLLLGLGIVTIVVLFAGLGIAALRSLDLPTEPLTTDSSDQLLPSP